MRLAEFKLIDKTRGALTWKIIERMQNTLESISNKNSMNYFSSIIARNQTNLITIDMNIAKREITINLHE